MSLSVQRNLDLKPFNTFGVAARARVVYTLEDVAQVDEVLEALQREVASTSVQQDGTRFGQEQASNARDNISKGTRPVPDTGTRPLPCEGSAPPRPLILSGGSNMVLARDLDEPVLLVRNRGRRIIDDDGDSVWIDVAAGEIWHDTVRWTLEQGCFGLENLVLIPGRVGAAPWQNIGAYGVEAGEHIESVEAIHLQTGERRRFTTSECAFAYRQSFFKTPAGRDWLILSVRLKLSRRFEPQLGYAELAQALQQQPATATSTTAKNTPDTSGRLSAPASSDQSDPSVTATEVRPAPHPLSAQQVADTVEAIRRRKLPDPAILGNAGSFFHNPVVDADTLEALRQQHPKLPAHPALSTDTSRSAPVAPVPSTATAAMASTSPCAGSHYKLSAGWLIDACGWKGYRDGDAGVSPNHALVLVNHGNATGAQILHLATRIQQSVFERFSLHLHPEPVILR